VAQAFSPARRPHVDADVGRVAIGGAGAGAGAGVAETGLGKMEVTSDLRFGLDRRLGRGGGTSMSEFVTPVGGLTADAGERTDDGRGGGGGGGLPIGAEVERPLFNE
jgi:hypothetical protein